MSVVVKTRHIKRNYLLSFKRNTPRRILADAIKRYAPYLNNNGNNDSIPIADTDWYRRMSDSMTPAKYLKTYREIAGYSQARLGGLVGIPAGRISDFETGQRSISKNTAKKLAEVFKSSPAVFI